MRRPLFKSSWKTSPVIVIACAIGMTCVWTRPHEKSAVLASPPDESGLWTRPQDDSKMWTRPQDESGVWTGPQDETAVSSHPNSCLCQIDRFTSITDCSNLSLRSIPDCVPNNTLVLQLQENRFDTLQPNMFRRFQGLRELNLGFNNIWRIENNAFCGLGSLVTLSLRRNNLRFNESYGDGDILSPLQQLTTLYLQGNCDSKHVRNCTYPERILSQVDTIKYLHVDGHKDIDLGNGFATQTNLQSLFLSHAEYSHCNLPKISKKMFFSLKTTTISTIILYDCDTNFIERGIFKDMKHLSHISISFGGLLDGLLNVTADLASTSIRHLCFIGFHNPNFLKIDGNVSKHLENTLLETLDISTNRIFYIDPSFVEFLPKSLKILSLRHNNIGDAKFLEKLVRLENLKTLDASYQNHYALTRITRDSDNKNDNSTQDQANPNVTAKLRHMFFSPFSKPDEIPLPRGLENIYMSNIKLNYPVPMAQFGKNKLTLLDASQCMLTALLGPVRGLDHLKYLNLSHNQLLFIHSKTFAFFGNLTTLYMQGNRLGKRNVSETVFVGLKNLELLNLSDNAVENIPQYMFDGLSSLRQLLLSGNTLTTIHFNLDSLSKLEYLDISNNRINDISKNNLDFFDNIATHRSVKLDLYGNDLKCTCSNNRLVKWIATTKVSILHKHKLRCSYENGTEISLERIHDILNQLLYDCSTWVVIICCAGVYGVGIFMLSLIVIIYYKRWRLRYLYYLADRGTQPYHPLEEGPINLDIDIYLSYDIDFQLNDEVTIHQFITRVIYPYLQARDYTVKIREELPPERNLNTSISSVIRISKRVVVFITTNFCRDYWNTFEFNMAALEGIYTKREILIPVLVGDIENILASMCPEIASFIRARQNENKVLYFPLESAKVNPFLRELENALR